MRKQLLHIGFLAAVFVAAVLFFEYMTTRGNDSMMADIGNASLPRLYFSVAGYGINPMNAYVDDMDMTAVRDTVTPVVKGSLQMNVEAGDKAITSIEYDVYSLSGEEMLFTNEITEISDQVTLSFDAEVEVPDSEMTSDVLYEAEGDIPVATEYLLATERLLKITVHTTSRDVYYYTRVVDSASLNLTMCMDYIYNYHESALEKAENKGVGAALEPSDAMSNTSYDYVNIHSNYNHVTWGDLKPRVTGGERWKIMEATSSYLSVLLEYEVSCAGEENDTDQYMVSEFFRVRKASDGMHLLNYERTMEQLFDGSKQCLSDSGILLGIRPEQVDYAVNDDGTVVSFVQANELWNYNRDKDELSLLFSFRDAENADVRNKVSDHTIHIMDVDEAGDTTFSVTGYMNRGAHEGRVGVAVYYYDINTNSIEEKAFVPSSKCAEVTAYDMGGLAYYSPPRNLLYVMNNGNFYEILVSNNRQNVLAEGLSQDQYVISDDAKKIAYQTGSSANESSEVVVMNLGAGLKYTVSGEEGECVIPLGFIGDDFACGFAKMGAGETTISGEEIVPMSRVEIRDSNNKIVKNYDPGKAFVTGATAKNGMITLNRVVKRKNGYKKTKDDYIASNQETEASNIKQEYYVTELKETQQRLTFVDGITDKNPKVLKPKQVLREQLVLPSFTRKAKDTVYYVYGLGTLQEMEDMAGDAIRKADEVTGVVIGDDGQYIWKRGNRYLTYTINDKESLIKKLRKKLKAGKDPMEIVGEIAGTRALDLTRCTTEQILYLINNDTPVIGLLSDGTAVILTGYSESNVTYMEVSGGESKTCTYADMDKLVDGRYYGYY